MIVNLDDDLIEGIVARYGPRVSRINLSSNGLRGLGNIERISPCLEKLNLSQNDLVDVRPLSRLSSLTDLNLADNNVSDLSALASLPLLQNLDISGNNISSIASLSCLPGQLSQLKSLHLEGNPVCGLLGYPHPVFAMFPTLETLDGIPREGARPPAATDLQQSQVMSQSSPSLSPTASSSSSSSAAALNALREQIETMERAFEMQERALTSSGLDAARQAASSFGSPSSEDAGVVEVDGDIESFPYLKLLQLWRRKALESMTQKSLTQKKLQQSLSLLKELRTKHGQEMKAQQLTALSYKEKGTAASEKASFWESKVGEAEAKLAQELRYRAIVDRERLDSQFKLRGLRSFLDRAKEQLEEEALAGMVRVDQAARKLKAFESRLFQAAERVQFAAALVAQKEVVLRNSAAAAEAIRRLQAAAPGLPAVSQQQEAENWADDSADESNPPLLSDLVLRPETEALLRTVFRKLDPSESGTVAVQVLRACLSSGDDADGQSDGDGGVLSTLQEKEEEEEDEDAITWTHNAGTLVRSALGPSQWARLHRGLASLAGAAEAMTWGEFLLLLLPRKDERLAALSGPELEALRVAGLWGDAAWGLVPLALPKVFDAHALARPAQQQSADIKRLQAERRFLMERVQDMGRTLERRAEAIKGHFELELRRARLKEGHLQTQVTELRSALESAETRLQDAAEAHNAIHKTATDRALAAEKGLAEAREALSARKNQETHALEACILEEKAKYTRLETEHNLLQREASKREIKCKGLQRDVMRLQAQLAEDKARLALESDNARASLATEAERLQSEWAAEKQALENRIAALEDQAAATATAAGGGGGGEGSTARDEFESVRQHMLILRSMPPPQNPLPADAPLSEQQEQLRKVVSAGGLGQTDVYAVHLNKLLRLAEEAISKSH